MIEDLWNDDKEIEAITFRRPNGLLIDTTTVNKYGEITVDQECFVYVKRM